MGGEEGTSVNILVNILLVYYFMVACLGLWGRGLWFPPIPLCSTQLYFLVFTDLVYNLIYAS